MEEAIRNLYLQKARDYCAQREHCSRDVQTKLYDWGVRNDAIDIIISQLISEDFLNEERYARAYASGKLKINHWGKHKIAYGLQMKGISKPNITLALRSIDDEEYMHILCQLIEKKEISTTRKDQLKTDKYLVSRGFSFEEIRIAREKKQ